MNRVLMSISLIAVQKVVSPITSKIYSQGSGSGSDQEPLKSHDEL